MPRFFRRPFAVKASTNPNQPDSDSEGEGSTINTSTSPTNKDIMSSTTSTSPIAARPRSKSKQNLNTLRVLFLSSDTGGGHRASAESLANQFKILFPGTPKTDSNDEATNEEEEDEEGTTYELLDVMAKGGVPPYNKLIESYKHLSAHPKQWNLFYKFTNSRAMEVFIDNHSKLMCERAIRKTIQEYDPDVVISVHPMMTNVPVLSCAKISEETGRHLPMFTVVTDLGSAHCLWFANEVDKMFIASDQIRELAKLRGKLPDEKLVQIGLPIRHQFAVQAEAMGGRMSDTGREYQTSIREELGLPFVDRKTLLVMGGGEGVGSLGNIVEHLYLELTEQGIDAVILVVCGRNEKLKNDLETMDWEQVELIHKQSKKTRVSRRLADLTFSRCIQEPLLTKTVDNGCMDGTVTSSIRKILSSSSLSKQNAMDELCSIETGSVDGTTGSVESGAVRASTPTNLAPTIESDESGETEDSTNLKEPLYDLSKDYSASKEEVETVQASHDDEEIDIFVTTSTTMDCPSSSSPTTLKPSNSNSDQFYQATSEDVASDPTTTTAGRPASAASTINQKRGKVAVVGLGFVTKMAEYMVAADILVSKAGPGTIAEAAALSLPVMLTSFLPGQEEGNVDFVVDGKFGAYVPDANPRAVAEEVATWLLDDEKMDELSKAAKAHGAPNAARDIVKHIGDLALKWKRINADRDRLEREVEALKLGISLSDTNMGGKDGGDDAAAVDDSRDAEL